jgi:hypothetical protein
MKYMIISIISIIVCPIIMLTGIRLQGKKEEKELDRKLQFIDKINRRESQREFLQYKGIQTYGDFKRTKMYLQAENTAICINNEDELYDEMYFPEELDHLPVIGIISKPDGMLGINLLCSNWDDRYEQDWVADIY